MLCGRLRLRRLLFRECADIRRRRAGACPGLIEVLDAKEVLGNGALPTVVLENVPSVRAAV